jgi:hypothetical protein
MFPLLKHTTNAITGHLGRVAAYTGASVAIMAPAHFLHGWIQQQYAGGLPAWYGAYISLQDLWFIATYSLLQTLVFSRLGADMDKPLWRCSGAQDAIRRFFPVWLLTNLIITALVRAEMRVAQAGIADAAALLGMFVLFAMVLLPMLAACLMFIGGLVWSRVDEAFRPIARHPAMALQVMFLGFTSFLLQNIVVMEESLAALRSPLGYTLLAIPISLLDIIAFAAMWQLCMYHRDHGHQHDGDPYDF